MIYPLKKLLEALNLGYPVVPDPYCRFTNFKKHQNLTDLNYIMLLNHKKGHIKPGFPSIILLRHEFISPPNTSRKNVSQKIHKEGARLRRKIGDPDFFKCYTQPYYAHELSTPVKTDFQFIHQITSSWLSKTRKKSWDTMN